MNPVLVEGAACPFCLHPSSARMARCRTGKPFFFCEACLTRAFLNTDKGYQSFMTIMRMSGCGKSFYPTSAPAPAPAASPARGGP